MNMFIPQSEIARADAREILALPMCIISDQGSKNIMGMVQDPVAGSYLMTDSSVIITEMKWNELVSQIFINRKFNMARFMARCSAKGLFYRSGKATISMIFPEDLHYKRKVSNDKEPMVEIKDGILIKGRLNKDTLGTSHNSLIQHITVYYGPRRAIQFMSELQFMMNRYHHMSLGYADCIGLETSSKHIMRQIKDKSDEWTKMLFDKLEESSRTGEVSEESKQDIVEQIEKNVSEVKRKLQEANIEKKVKSIVEKRKKQAQELTNKMRQETNPGKVAKMEAQITDILNNIRGEASTEVINSLPDTNAFKIMSADAGAKGSSVNIAQIYTVIGQQEVGNKRIPMSIAGGSKSLPMFRAFDTDPVSQGNVDRSYMEGATPEQFFFMSAAGREGIVDTAVGTWVYGYIQSKLSTCMGDLITMSDGSVRHVNGKIIQFRYGGDGLDPAKLMKSNGKLRFVNVETLAQKITSEDRSRRINESRRDQPTEESNERKQRKYIIKELTDYKKLEGKEVRRTLPFVSKFEASKLIGSRAHQLASGQEPLVDINIYNENGDKVGQLVDPLDIAYKELKEDKFPMILKRKMGKDEYEEWTIDELIFSES